MPTKVLPECSTCGHPVSGFAQRGVCLSCWLRSGLASPDSTSRTDPGSAKSGSSLPVPDVLGDYEILGHLAEGGMGVVFYARQITLNRPVALKMIRSGEFATAEEVQRFRAEATAVANLDHPNIVSIYEIGEAAGRHFFSMQLVEGGNLAEELAHGPMDGRKAARLIEQVACAVHHAHQHGILHRDIKPSNILLDDSGQPHLTDFGLARFLHRASSATSTRAVMGTPSYMAPEQLTGGAARITTAADIYSLGAVLYEMLAGRPPFGGESALEILSNAANREAPRLCRLHAAIDRDLEVICFKCLEKDPARRYPSALALAEDLARWLKREPILARPAGPWERASKWSRRNPILAVVSAVAFLSLLGGFVGVLSQWNRAERNATATRDRLVRFHVATGVRYLDAGDSFSALPWFAEALHQSVPEESANHRLRLASTLQQTPTLLQMWFPGAHVSSAAFTSDGQAVLIASGTNRVELVSTVTGKPVCGPLWHPGSSRVQAKLSPDEQYILSFNRTDARLWSAKTGTLLQIFTQEKLQDAVFSPKGETIALGSSNGSVQVFALHAPSQPLYTTRVPGNVHLLLFAPRGHRLLACTESAAHILALDEGPSLVIPLKSSLRHAAWSPDGQSLVTAHANGTAQVWNAVTGRNVTGPLQHGSWLTHVAFSPDGKTIAASAGGHVAKVWNAITGKKLTDLGGNKSVVTGTAFSPSGRRIVTTCFDGTARVYDAASGTALFPPFHHGGLVTSASFAPQGDRLLTAGADGTVKLWSLWPKARTVVPWGNRDAGILFVSRNGSIAILQAASNILEIVSTDSWKPLFPPVHPAEPVHQAWLAPDFTRLFTASCTNLRSAVQLIEMWDTKTGRLLSSFHYEGTLPLRIEPSPDSRLLAIVSSKRLEVVNPTNGTPLFPAKVVPSTIRASQFSPDAKQFLLAYGPQVELISPQNGNPIFPPLNHSCAVSSAEFSSDGRFLVSTTRDSLLEPREAIVWDTQTGRPVGPPLRHADGLFHASFSPDSQRAITAGEDDIARLWDVRTAQPLTPPLRHSVAVHHASFSPDGLWVATASQDKSARVWDAKTGEPLTPKLRHDYLVNQADFLGRHLLTRSGYIIHTLWSLPHDNRPSTDLLHLAGLLSSQSIDSTGALIPISASILEKSWSHLHARYPSEFSHPSAPVHIPKRLSDANPAHIDLTAFYNSSLSELGHPGVSGSLSAPVGLTNFGGVTFDVRGIAQLAGTELMTWGTRPFPETIRHIPVQAGPSSTIHLLHGTIAYTQPGQKVASLILRYTDGDSHEIPIISGEDTSDWATWSEPRKPSKADIVWTSSTSGTRTWSPYVAWYKSSWPNPFPEKPLQSIDLISGLTTAAPYILAITLAQ